MFRYLYHRLLGHGSYIKNEHGIKKFAERCMGELTRKVTKKSAFYREMNENLMVEKANLRLRQNELQENDMLDSGEFFSMRRRLRANTTIVVVFIIASIFMNTISVTAIIEGDTALQSFLRWFGAISLATVLTGGGLIVTERLIESIMPRRRARRADHFQNPGAPMTVLWAVLLGGILVATYGFSGVRAGQFASGEGSQALYLGFVTLALLLPIIAGAVRWDALRYIDIYKTTQTLREIESRLAQIDSILRQNEEYESNFYKIRSISYWDKVNEFKTYKDNYNEKNGLVEPLKGHFSRSYDAFQSEASKRYTSDIRDLTSSSMRKLERPDSDRQKVGSKIGQEGSGTLMPASSEGDSAEEASRSRSEVSPENGSRSDRSPEPSESYLEPQRVR